LSARGHFARIARTHRPHASPARIARTHRPHASPASPLRREAKMINVMLNHEDALVLDSLRRMLSSEPDIEIAAETNTIAGLLTQVETHQPDVIILDAVLPDADILNMIAQLQSLPTQPNILILSTFNDVAKMSEILIAGALGYCSRCDDPKLIPAAVRAVAAGLPCTSPTVRRRLLEYVRPKSDPLPAMSDFTEREQDVLRLLAKGLTRQQIANSLKIADRTLRDYLDCIRGKTGLTTREEMIVYAVKLYLDDEL
jgi:DNA-binding NarL/FixJ family response regulator